MLIEEKKCPWSEPVRIDHRLSAGQLVELRLPPGMLIPPHDHETAHVCLVVQGEIRDLDGGEGRRINAGQLRHSSAADRHLIQVGPEGAICFIMHSPLGAGDDSLRRQYQSDGHLTRLAMRLVDQLRREDFPAERVRALMLEIFAQGSRFSAGRKPGDSPEWLLSARSHLEQDLTQRIGLDDLARYAGVHRAQLARAFKNHFGCSVGDHLRILRAEAARRLVLETDLPLARIAVDSGHADQSHLTRRFREAYGCTPAAMRRSRVTESG